MSDTGLTPGERNIQIIKNFLVAQANDDVEGFWSVYDEDFEQTVGEPALQPIIPWMGVWKGREHFETCVELYHNSPLDYLDYQITEFMPVDDNRLVCTGFAKYWIEPLKKELHSDHIINLTFTEDHKIRRSRRWMECGQILLVYQEMAEIGAL